MKFLNTFFCLLSIWIVIVALPTGHTDMSCTVQWGIILIDSILNGDLYYYADTLRILLKPTEYSFFSNFVLSVILMPMYVILRSCDNYTIPYYLLYYKFILALGTIFSSYLIGRIGLNLNLKKHEIRLVQILYLSSMFVQPVSVLFGQVDFIGNIFLISGIYFLLNSKIRKSNLMFAMSMCFKPFSAVIIIPICCISFYRIKKDWLCSIIILLLFPLLCRLFPYLFIHDYYKHAMVMLRGINYFPKLIGYHSYTSFIICVIICFILLLKSKKLTYDPLKIIILPLIIFALFAMRPIHFQWEVYEATSVVFLIIYIMRINPILGIASYVFINMIQFYKFFSIYKNYYTGVFEQSIFYPYLSFGYYDKAYAMFGHDYIFLLRYAYLIAICLLVLFINSKKAKNSLIFSSLSIYSCKIASIICLAPIFYYFLTLFDFVGLK